jgi:tetratricopeptide (TPR) repeat protein
MAKLAEQNADQAHGLIYKFRLAEARKDLKAAEDVASEMVDTFPAFARSWVDFGDVLRQKGKYDDAIAKYTMALDRQAGNLESLRGIVECYLLMNSPRLEDAKSYIDQGRKLFPHDPWFKEREVAWFLDNDPKQAIPTREQEAKAAPDKIGPQIALYAAWWELAKQQLQKGKPEDAHQPMQKAHDGFAQVLTKWPGEQELEYAYFADICSQIGDFQGGEKALKEMAAVPKWKDNPKPTIMLAEYYGRIGKQAEAEAAWKDALMLSKNAPGVRQQVAAYYLGVHKYDEALKLVDVNAKDRPTQQLLIQIYMASGKLTDAEKYLDAMLKDAPDDSRLLSIKGMLMLQEDKTASALDQLNKALLADPKNASAYFDRGLIHLRLGQADLPDAIKDFTSARDLADTGNLALQVQSRLSLGEAMRAHGQSEEAITELSAALRMQPSNKELRMRLIEMLGTLLTPRWSDVENLIHEAQNMPDFRKDPDWWRVEAQMWAQRKEDEKSLTAIREALRLSAGQPQRIVPLMQDYLMVLIKLKHFPELESEAGELLKSPQIVDSGWWVYQARAIAEARQGQKQEALDDFDKGLEITNRLRNDDGTMMIVQSISDTIGVDQAIARLEKEAAKGDNHWRVIIVDLYLNKQDYPRAQAKVEALLADIDKLKPSEQEATYVVAGLTYMLSGKYEQARSMYEKLLAVQPNDTVALNNLACLYSDDLNPPDAAKALGFSTRAFELMQKSGQMDPNVLETQGWILVRNNRVDEGISNIQMALDRRAIMEGYYHLGYAFLQKKLALEAQAALERAQKMLNDRKDKGEPIDAKLQSSITDTLAKAKSMANGPATAPGTRPAVKP